MRRDGSGYAVAFAAALLFGISAPAAKLLLDTRPLCRRILAARIDTNVGDFSCPSTSP